MLTDLLILGGTTQARLLAEALATQNLGRIALSLAGRTKSPIPVPVPTRSGGFGGIAGLTAWLQAQKCKAVIDATHPFAAQMGSHALAACGALGVPLLRLSRAPWQAEAGDRWIEAADMAQAVASLGDAPCRAFLTVGRLNLAPFSAAPQHHYVIRTVDAPDPPPNLPHMTLIAARGPFSLEEEEHFMRKQAIEWLVTKNAGGSATQAKLIAARNLALPVIMVSRPQRPQGQMVEDVSAAVAWWRHLYRCGAQRGE